MTASRSRHGRSLDRHPDPVDQRPGVEVHRGFEETLLTREVRVGRGRAEVRLPGDVGDRSAAVAVEGEAPHRDLEEELAGPVALGVADLLRHGRHAPRLPGFT